MKNNKTHKTKKKKTKIRKKHPFLEKAGNVFFLLILIIGIGLMSYPSISNLVNQNSQTHTIADYTKITKDMSAEEKQDMWNQADRYNKTLLTTQARFSMSDSDKKIYNDTLDITGTGVMAYLKIPKINVELPIYHRTSEGSLRSGLGHVAGSSLPIGGASTHSAISGHTGLPSSKLFTNIDKLKKGDKFIIKTLDRTETYEVDQIKIVLPDDMSDLGIVPGKDYCTLITCTPYGINDHRLLVRGHRVKDIIPEPNISSTDPITIAMLIAAAILIIAFIKKAIHLRKQKKANKLADKKTDPQHIA